MVGCFFGRTREAADAMTIRQAHLALEDGTVYSGRAFGADGESFGEVVFNTSMTGYQEVLTDPSYTGQIVTMTYPLIGNYGINAEDRESCGPRVEGFDTRSLVRRLRVRGVMNGVLSSTDLDDASLVHKARSSPHIVGRDLARTVMPEKPFAWSEGFCS